MSKKKCILKPDEVKLINEYLESFKQEKSRDKAIQMMAEKREGDGDQRCL